ncbi:hypothetical protein BDN70DRAFT_184168 [Pholiota conissans]|uniref:Uncharacterized protein n=1 Tax=Pholiota conissans TaxID=109636 RepID=A0A9P5YYP3_9AGAR|nr:hypothetical protein BDN70DRAFT_184168 [Pholiota conissans]
MRKRRVVNSNSLGAGGGSRGCIANGGGSRLCIANSGGSRLCIANGRGCHCENTVSGPEGGGREGHRSRESGGDSANSSPGRIGEESAVDDGGDDGENGLVGGVADEDFAWDGRSA